MSRIRMKRPNSSIVNKSIPPVSAIILAMMVLVSSQPHVVAQNETTNTTFKVTVDKPENGSITIKPPIPEDGKVAAGTVLTVIASPVAGYALDSGYYTTPGPWGPADHEFATTEFQVTMDQSKGIGASFIEKKALEGLL